MVFQKLLLAAGAIMTFLCGPPSDVGEAILPDIIPPERVNYAPWLTEMVGYPPERLNDYRDKHKIKDTGFRIRLVLDPQEQTSLVEFRTRYARLKHRPRTDLVAHFKKKHPSAYLKLKAFANSIWDGEELDLYGYSYRLQSATPRFANTCHYDSYFTGVNMSLFGGGDYKSGNGEGGLYFDCGEEGKRVIPAQQKRGIPLKDGYVAAWTDGVRHGVAPFEGLRHQLIMVWRPKGWTDGKHEEAVRRDEETKP